MELTWLDVAAAGVLGGADVGAIRDDLFEILEGKVSGGRKRGSAAYKTVSVLCNVWVSVPPELVDFRDRAAAALPLVSWKERVAIHWSMLLAGFPFFGNLVGHIGRLLTLQESVSLSQLDRRMKEDFGDRSTLSRAAQRLVRSLVDWGVLRDAGKRGVYMPLATSIHLGDDSTLILVEGLLRHLNRGVLVAEIESHPSLFAFQFALSRGSFRNSDKFEVHRQGLDTDYIELR